MQLTVRITDSDLAEVFKAYVVRRLRFALGRYGARVGQITVRITGDGRAEHRCRISTEVMPFGRVAVEESDPDLFAAIDRATGRAGRLFGRELERVRERKFGRDSIRTAA